MSQRTVLGLCAIAAVLVLGTSVAPGDAAGLRTLTVDFKCRGFNIASTQRVQTVPCAGRPWKQFKADVDGAHAYRHTLKLGRARVYMTLNTVGDNSSPRHIHGTWRITKGTRRFRGIQGSGTVRGALGAGDTHLFFKGSATVPSAS